MPHSHSLIAAIRHAEEVSDLGRCDRGSYWTSFDGGFDGVFGRAFVAVWAQGDFNGDGIVEVLADAFLLISQLGQSVLP